MACPLRILPLAALLLLGSGCPTPPPECTDGAATDCQCEDGRAGTKTCTDGTFGACQCAPAPTCSASSLAAKGALQTPQGALDYTGAVATVEARHKIDVDVAEDGCVAKLTVHLKLGSGCVLELVFDDKGPGFGGLVSMSLSADSFCPGFPDATEGLYASDARGYAPIWFTGPSKVDQPQALEACLQTTISFPNRNLTLYRALPSPAQLTVNLVNLSLDGSLLSRGDANEGCVPQRVCTGTFHDGGSGFCLPAGSCSDGFHDDGTGVCASSGCATGYHDGGDGKCVANGSCSAGYHDDGVGTCVTTGCATGYHAAADGICVNDLTHCTDGAASRPVRTPNAGQLFVSEVMADPATVTDANGEWFELSATTAVDLNQLRLAATATGAATVIQPTGFACLPVASGAKVVIARTQSSGTNGGLSPVWTFGFGLSNSGGEIHVRKPSDAIIDSAAFPAMPSGVSVQLAPGDNAADNDLPTAFCESIATFAPNNEKGTPGLANSARPACACVDGATGQPRFAVAPAANGLVISELLANPDGAGSVSDADGEWFELYNAGTTPFDLNGIQVGNGGTTLSELTAAQCVQIAAGEYRLAAHRADTANGGLPAVDVTFTTALLNSASSRLRLTRADGALIDEATYPTAVAGVSSQLNQTSLTATANDSTANYCPGTSVYGAGDKGTPRRVNDCP